MISSAIEASCTRKASSDHSKSNPAQQNLTRREIQYTKHSGPTFQHTIWRTKEHTQRKTPPPWPLNPKPYKMQARPRPRIPSSKPRGGLQRPVGWWCHSRPGPPGSYFCWRKRVCACCGVAGLVGAVLFCFFWEA